jgi:hypothetical protein
MDPYFSFFIVGSAGLVLMAVMGAAGGHGGHAQHGGHDAGGFHLHGTGAHAHGHADVSFHHAPVSHTAPASAHGHAAHNHAHHGHGHHAHAEGFNLRAALMGWLSPRVLLTLSMGAGAAGVCLASVLPMEPWRALVSLGAGAALEKLLVAPLWNTLSRFASAPARTLDSAVMEEALALANFDAQGFGLVSIVLDGHEMRLLARLSPEHEQDRVRTGDKLLVESVDGARGRCVVSPVSHAT